jgi:hypothetical protein
MWRILGFLGLAFLFLAISAPLRSRVMGLLAAFVAMLARYGPFSYVLFAAVVLIAFLIFVSTGSKPR